jgi:hypothetical protein
MRSVLTLHDSLRPKVQTGRPRGAPDILSASVLLLPAHSDCMQSDTVERQGIDQSNDVLHSILPLISSSSAVQMSEGEVLISMSQGFRSLSMMTSTPQLKGIDLQHAHNQRRLAHAQ